MNGSENQGLQNNSNPLSFLFDRNPATDVGKMSVNSLQINDTFLSRYQRLD
jgi:hypothetical protein